MAWTKDGRWIPEDDSVETRLTGLLANDSKYMTTARAAGTRTAARRGLLNSSIAAGSAESAAIAAAAPIASQDASQTFQRNQATLETGLQSDLSKQSFNQQSDLNRQQNEASLATIDKQAGYQRELAQMQEAAALERAKLSESGATARQLADFDQRTAEQIRNIESQTAQQERQLSSAERQAMMAADTNILQSQISANSQLSSQYLSAFSNLAASPDIPANVRNAYIAEFQRVMKQGQGLINLMDSAEVTWSGTPAQPIAPSNAPPIMNGGGNVNMAARERIV
jgi:hypothetical protein